MAWRKIQPLLMKYRRYKSLYTTSYSPVKDEVNSRIPSVIEIKPIDIKKFEVNQHAKDSGFYRPEMFEESYAHHTYQFKNRWSWHRTPHK